MVTGSDGRATVVYTAPAAPSVAVDNGTVVEIVITPVGTDYANTTARTAAIRLVPPGSVAPPDGLKPNFTFTPSSPVDSQTVLFDASGSTSAAAQPDRELLVELRRRRPRHRRDGGPPLHDGWFLRRHADHLGRLRAQRSEVGQHRGHCRSGPDGSVHVVTQRFGRESGGESFRQRERAGAAWIGSFSTSSIRAIGAPSPLRGPSFRIRV